MNGLNGIILNGKFYEVVDADKFLTCEQCDLKDECYRKDAMWDICKDLFGYETNLRFSQTLTDKLNGNGIQQKDTTTSI